MPPGSTGVSSTPGASSASWNSLVNCGGDPHSLSNIPTNYDHSSGPIQLVRISLNLQYAVFKSILNFSIKF